MDGSVDSSLVLTSAGTKADALIIEASNTAGGIDMDAGTGGIAIDTLVHYLLTVLNVTHTLQLVPLVL